MNTVTNCLFVFAIVVTVLQNTEASKRSYHFPSNCTCQYRNGKVTGRPHCDESTCYPDSSALGIQSDCFPSVPENHRFCFRTIVKECSGERGHKCSLYKGKSAPLPQVATANQNTVHIASPDLKFSFKSVCFYNISINNCSYATLRHVEDQPRSEYLDVNANENSTCGYPGQCNDYLRLYYGEDNRQTETFCGERLATLQHSVPLSEGSFLAVYWADNGGSGRDSFEVIAECAGNL